MAQADIRNDFLLDLLALQQDGSLAISAPTNWIKNEPILEISTDIDNIIFELQEAIIKGTKENDTARWHFFVGSPGNGKSAAMGKLCRRLIFDRGCKLLDERGVSIIKLEPSIIPYAINVFEDGNKFASAQIVQDASVVRRPFASDVDPAIDLKDSLEYAWEKGISLVICTNRGVLEKAYRDNHTKPTINKTAWFKILKAVVKATSSSGEIEKICPFNSKKTIFSKVKVKYDHLDNRSLIRGVDTFEGLVQKAISDEHWTSCLSCTMLKMCPFKANRDWLANDGARAKVLQMLTRAEVLSGQIIVFREALALLSLILAGCPRDYDSMHPCTWVQTKILSNDIFPLASRRIYMNLFSSFSPNGLESNENLRLKQLSAFQEIWKVIDEEKTCTRASLKHVIDNHPPSTDVGVKRLIGEKGTFTVLDPSTDALPPDFYDRWDSDFDAVPTKNQPCFTDLEKTCLTIWKDIEEVLEQTADHSVSEAHRALRRWSSNFLLHFGALMEGHSAWARELDEFSTLLGLMSKRIDKRDINDKIVIRNLDEQLGGLLNSSKGNQDSNTVKLSENIILTGQWVNDQLKPNTAGGETAGSISLGIKFRGGEHAEFAALMYLWLTRRSRRNLDDRCFPTDLLAGIEDARIRAASKGDYAIANDDVELVIKTGDNEVIRVTRFEGDVIVK
jgi:hypothetical protein